MKNLGKLTMLATLLLSTMAYSQFRDGPRRDHDRGRHGDRDRRDDRRDRRNDRLIRVIKAEYGPGDITDSVVSECNGKETCAYFISVDKVGDPNRGVPKAVDVVWYCGDEKQPNKFVPAEADRQTMILDCRNRPVAGINIISAIFAGNCNRRDITDNIKAKCNGQISCQGRSFNVRDVGGDPCPGTPKELDVRYFCSGGRDMRIVFPGEASDKDLGRISCQ